MSPRKSSNVKEPIPRPQADSLNLFDLINQNAELIGSPKLSHSASLKSFYSQETNFSKQTNGKSERRILLENSDLMLINEDFIDLFPAVAETTPRKTKGKKKKKKKRKVAA